MTTSTALLVSTVLVVVSEVMLFVSILWSVVLVLVSHSIHHAVANSCQDTSCDSVPEMLYWYRCPVSCKLSVCTRSLLGHVSVACGTTSVVVSTPNTHAVDM